MGLKCPLELRFSLKVEATSNFSNIHETPCASDKHSCTLVLRGDAGNLVPSAWEQYYFFGGHGCWGRATLELGRRVVLQLSHHDGRFTPDSLAVVEVFRSRVLSYLISQASRTIMSLIRSTGEVKYHAQRQPRSAHCRQYILQE